MNILFTYAPRFENSYYCCMKDRCRYYLYFSRTWFPTNNIYFYIRRLRETYVATRNNFKESFLLSFLNENITRIIYDRRWSHPLWLSLFQKYLLYLMAFLLESIILRKVRTLWHRYSYRKNLCKSLLFLM